MLGLNKQDATNGTCVASWNKSLYGWHNNNTVNKIAEIMNYSKSTANASG